MPSPRRLSRSPALDGIRAVAIVLVVLVHIGARQGGFVGVDLFFVLSGFLITTLLLQERDLTGGVRLSRFYQRRACRLLPALGAAIVLGLVARSVVPYRPAQWPYWAAALAAAFYATNWVQFTDRHATRLLAHTWSLAVEEQFYLLWPAALLGALARFRRETISTLPLVGAVISLSLASLLVGYRLEPGLNWYVATSSCAGELMLGAGLSILWRRRRVPHWLTAPPTVAAALGALGWMFLVARENSPWLYRWGGLYAPAAVGVVLVATVMERPGSALTRLLSQPPFTFTGRISYSMYLYNYPLTFILSEPVLGIATAYCQLLMVAATWALATVSYFAFERRVIAWGRRHEPGNPPPAAAAGPGAGEEPSGLGPAGSTATSSRSHSPAAACPAGRGRHRRAPSRHPPSRRPGPDPRDLPLPAGRPSRGARTNATTARPRPGRRLRIVEGAGPRPTGRRGRHPAAW